MIFLRNKRDDEILNNSKMTRTVMLAEIRERDEQIYKLLDDNSNASAIVSNLNERLIKLRNKNSTLREMRDKQNDHEDGRESAFIHIIKMLAER